MKTTHRIAVIAGDGIGTEVMPEGLRAVEAAARRFDIAIAFDHFDFASWNWYEKHGSMMPDDWKEQIGGHDAIFFGAVGWPAKIPDHVSLWGSLIKFRREFDLYVNLRPARLMPGIRSPLAGLAPGDIDMMIVRENTEGEYSGVGGRSHRGMAHEVAIDTTVFTALGCERVVRHAFTLAAARRGTLINATKSNASRHAYPFWDEVVERVGADFPQVTVQRVLVDALAARMILNPASVDVVVASNLFGDILTDVAAALQGGLGMAASASLSPGSDGPALFEPVHGSAPDIAGRGIANPSGAIWSAALMLDHLGEPAAAARVMRALEAVCAGPVRTRDIGGGASTVEVGDAVLAALDQPHQQGAPA
jgi:tartrate dehydrogenase/decarboxylase/D-malate dehydrogenase